MAKNMKTRGTRKLTDEIGFEDNRGSKMARSVSPDIDPRIVGLVRMLARKAAERDFARFARLSESANPRPRKT